MECTLLERFQALAETAGPLRRDAQGVALPDSLRGVVTGGDGGLPVSAVEQDKPRVLKHLAQDRQIACLDFAHHEVITFYQCGRDIAVEHALMVDDEDRRALFPQVLLIFYLQFHAGEIEGIFRVAGETHQGRALAVSCAQPLRHLAGDDRGRHCPIEGAGSRDIQGAGPGAAAEPADWPAGGFRMPLEVWRRIHRHRVTDRLQQWHILEAIRVEPGVVKADLPGFGPLLCLV